MKVLGVLLVLAGGVCADLISTSADLHGATVVDFRQFAGGITFTTGPVEVGELVGETITWRTQQASGTSVIGDPSFGLGNNGTWDSGRIGYTALNLETGHMDYLFDAPVSGVGGFVSYGYSAGNPEPNPTTIVALGSGFNPIESYSIYALAPVATPLRNDGAFRGIKRAANDIYGFRVVDSFVVLDDLTFSRVGPSPAPVPELGTYAMLGLALAG